MVETITGAKAPEKGGRLWTLLFRGHLRLLQKPAALNEDLWLQQHAAQAGIPMDAPGLGWEFYITRAQEDPRTSPGTIDKTCRCCHLNKQRYPVRPRLVGGISVEERGLPRMHTVLNALARVDPPTTTAASAGGVPLGSRSRCREGGREGS